tara:strand:- start:237 stop:509 length:273 start_codon:yes stop_codon:yes gene_type:complete
MGKKEKVIDLKPKVDKISKQHLTELQNIVNNVNGMQFNIGKIEAQKFGLLNGLIKAQDGIRVLQEKLVKEYGTYDVNLDDGMINWPKDEK